MANANSNTSFSANDFQKITEGLREASSMSWLMIELEKEIPQGIAADIAESIYHRVQSSLTLTNELWNAYRELDRKLAAATQLVSMARKGEVDHG